MPEGAFRVRESVLGKLRGAGGTQHRGHDGTQDHGFRCKLWRPLRVVVTGQQGCALSERSRETKKESSCKSWFKDERSCSRSLRATWPAGRGRGKARGPAPCSALADGPQDQSIAERRSVASWVQGWGGRDKPRVIKGPCGALSGKSCVFPAMLGTQTDTRTPLLRAKRTRSAEGVTPTLAQSA